MDRAEVADEGAQRRFGRGRARDDERVVIAGDREDGRRVVTIRFVKLVVVVLRLPEIVDEDPEMIEKGWAVGGVGLVAVAGQLIGHADLPRVLQDVRGARVPGGMEDNLGGPPDPLHDLRSMHAKRVL